MKNTIFYLKNNKYISIFNACIKAIISSLAINTILIMAPSIQIKFAFSLLIVLKNIVDLNKIIKYSNVEKKNFYANKILHELEITKKNKKTVNTRFDDDLINYINVFLKRNNEDIPSSYLDLRNKIYNLDIDKKINLINLLNNLTGNKYDTKIFDSCSNNLYKEFKNSIIKPILIGASMGMFVATSINSVDPSIMASIYNSAGLGILFNNISKKSTIGIIGMVLGTILTKSIQFIPIVGTSLIAKENIILTSIITSSFYLIFNTGKKIFNSVKNYIQKKIFINNYKKDLDIDSILYAKDNFDNYVVDKNIINIITYLKENNINISNASSILELKMGINKLSFINKIKVTKLLTRLERKNMSFKDKLFKCGKDFFSTLCYTIVLVLGLLTIVDIFIDNTFLDSLRLQLFPNSYKKYDLIKDVKIEKVIESPTCTPTPTCTPSPSVPSPLPGPAPDLYVSEKMVPEVKMVPEENLVKMDFINNPNFVNELCLKNGKDMYDTLNSLDEYKFISYSVKNMNLDSICKLTDYINSSTIDRSNINYSFIKDSVNERLIEINKYVQSIMDKTKTTSVILGGSNFIISSKKKTLKK